jgi:phage protein D
MRSRDLFFKVTVKAPGAEYDLSKDLTSFTVEEDDRMADKLTVVVPDRLNVFSLALREGLDVDVDLGYSDNHSIVFRGLVTQVNAAFPDDAVPAVTMIAYDNSIRMGLNRRNKQWTDIDLQGIVAEIARASGFTNQKIELPDGGNPEYTGNGIRQRETTDLAFLLELADAQRCKVFVDAEDTGDVFYFKSQKALMTADPASKVRYRCRDAHNNLLNFSVSSDISRRSRKRVSATVNPETGQATTAQRDVEVPPKSETASLGESLTEFGKRVPSRAASLTKLIGAADAAYSSIVDARGEDEREITVGLYSAQQLQQRTVPQASTTNEGMSGSGVAEGNKDMRAKRNIQIDAVGGRFSGKWYLSQVRHVVDGSGYRTHFTCSR